MVKKKKYLLTGRVTVNLSENRFLQLKRYVKEWNKLAGYKESSLSDVIRVWVNKALDRSWIDKQLANNKKKGK